MGIFVYLAVGGFAAYLLAVFYMGIMAVRLLFTAPPRETPKPLPEHPTTLLMPVQSPNDSGAERERP